MVAAWTQYFASWPEAGTVAFINQARGLYNQRLANCRSQKGTDRFIQYDVTGDSSGGGGSGTSVANPWKVTTWDEAVTLITANLGAGNIRFRLRGSDVYYGTTRLTINQPNVCISSYDNGYPVITSFRLETEIQAGAWTQADGNRWTKVFTGITNLTWVRGTDDLADIRNGGETSRVRVNFTTDAATTRNLVRDNANTFYLEVSGSDTTVHLYATSDPADTVMISRGITDAGILVSQVDGCRVEKLDLIGLCIQDDLNVRTPLAADLSGTKECVFSDCAVYYGGSAHSIVMYASTGGAGGVLTYDRCKAGYAHPADTGGGTEGGAELLTSYNANGGHEMMVRDFEATYGTLPTRGTAANLLRRGRPIYAHTDGVGSHYVGLAIILGCTTKNHVHGCRSNANLGNLTPYTTSHLNTDEYRAWIIDEVVEAGSGTFPDHDDAYLVRINCRYRFRPLAIADGNRASITLISASFTSRKTLRINCLYEDDIQNSSGGTNAIRYYANANSQEPITWLHCDLRAIGGAVGSVLCFWQAGIGAADQMQITNKRAFNTLFGIEYNSSPLRHQICNNAAPSTDKSDTPTSGYSHCAHWSDATIQEANSGSGGTLRLGYNLGTNYRDNGSTPALASMPVALAAPATGLLSQGTTSLPIVVEYDIDYRLRHATTPSIGTNEPESQPLATLTDFSDPAGAAGSSRSSAARRLLLGI